MWKQCRACSCSAGRSATPFHILQRQGYAKRLNRRKGAAVRVYAQNEEPESVRQDRDTLVVAVSTAVFTGLAMVTANLAPSQLQDVAELILQPTVIGDFGIADIVGALMWSLGLYLCSPLQYLLLFFGRFDTERPADWILKKLGRATGQRVDEVDYVAPWYLQALTTAFFGVSGCCVVYLLTTSLGDSTWSVATGMGALLGAATYEVGRPRRLSVDEAQTLEKQWQDFAIFANKRLQRSGQCHETEVWMAFRRDYGKYRVAGVLSNEDLRSMVRNWHPDVRRSSTGYYKNLSLRPYVDPFTGERSGSEAAQAAARAPVAPPAAATPEVQRVQQAEATPGMPGSSGAGGIPAQEAVPARQAA